MKVLCYVPVILGFCSRPVMRQPPWFRCDEALILVVVKKSHSPTTLNFPGGSHFIKRYRSVVRNPKGPRSVGDKRTPEGRYFCRIKGRISFGTHSEFYPNSTDLVAAPRRWGRAWGIWRRSMVSQKATI